MKKDKSDACLIMAETVGFEPTEDLHPQRISSPLHSASLPRFQQINNFKIGGSGEIRTHGGLSTLDGFQDRCIKPLCHASVLSRFC